MAIVIAKSCNIILIAVVNRCIWNCLSNRSVFSYEGVFYFITCSRLILCPENHRIWCGCISFPACVNSGFLTDSTAKLELPCRNAGIVAMRISVFFGIIPALETIAVSDHRIRRRCCRVISQDEFRGVISTAFAVFIKDKPVSFRLLYSEFNAAGNGHRGAVFVRF